MAATSSGHVQSLYYACTRAARVVVQKGVLGMCRLLNTIFFFWRDVVKGPAANAWRAAAAANVVRDGRVVAAGLQRHLSDPHANRFIIFTFSFFTLIAGKSAVLLDVFKLPRKPLPGLVAPCPPSLYPPIADGVSGR